MVDVLDATSTPSTACVALPVVISSVAIRLASSDGMANPIPMFPDCVAGCPGTVTPLEPVLAIAALMPMTLPFRSTNAPPELPGLIAASV